MNPQTPRGTRRNVDRALSEIAQLAGETSAKILPFPIPKLPELEYIGYRKVFPGRTVTSSGNYIGSHINGDSLSGDSILDGDILICRVVKKGEDVEGCLVLVETPRGLLARRYFKHIGGRVCLRASNPDFADLIYRPEEIEVRGVGVRLERDL
jgi:hypothetical protein